jgi:hypothetical protein
MQAIAVFTNRGLGRMLAEGGAQVWRINPERAETFKRVSTGETR